MKIAAPKGRLSVFWAYSQGIQDVKAVNENWQRNATAAIIVIFAIVLTLHAGLSRLNLDEWGDMAENFAWGELWQWGYYKHPPFFGWAVAAWFSVFPREDWFYYLFSSLNNTVALIVLWRIAKRFGNANFQLFVIAAAILMQPFSFQAVKYNANAAMTPLWAGMILFYLRGLEKQRWMDALVLGILTGLSMLAKYYSAVIVLALFLHAVFDREARGILLSAFGAIVAAISILVFLPHVYWLFHNDFAPIIYALSQGDGSFTDSLIYFVNFSGGVVIYLLPEIALAFLMRSRNDGYPVIWLERMKALRSSVQGRALLSAGFLSIAITIVLSFAASADLSIVWALPVFVPMAVIVATLLPDDLLQRNVIRVFYVLGIFFVGLIVSAPFIKAQNRTTTAKELATPARQVAAALDNYWKTYGDAKMGYVIAGDHFLSDSITFYSVYRPIKLENSSLESAKGYLDADQIKTRGLIFICKVSDDGCRVQAAAFSAGRSDAIKIDFSVTGYDGVRQWPYWALILKPVDVVK